MTVCIWPACPKTPRPRIQRADGVVRIGRTGHRQGGHGRLGVRQTDRAVLCCGSSAGVAGAGADAVGAELVGCST